MSVNASAAAMASSIGMALSGLRAEQAQLDAHADNVANADTAGYTSQQVVMSAVPGGGVRASGSGSLGAMPATPATLPPSNVDLGQEMAGLLMASTLYGADAKTVTVQSRMDRAVLNIVA